MLDYVPIKPRSNAWYRCRSYEKLSLCQTVLEHRSVASPPITSLNLMSAQRAVLILVINHCANYKHGLGWPNKSWWREGLLSCNLCPMRLCFLSLFSSVFCLTSGAFLGLVSVYNYTKDCIWVKYFTGHAVPGLCYSEPCKGLQPVKVRLGCLCDHRFLCARDKCVLRKKKKVFPNLKYNRLLMYFWISACGCAFIHVSLMLSVNVWNKRCTAGRLAPL